MARKFLSSFVLIVLCAGCSGTRVHVDGHLVNDSSLWHHLDGPSYRIVGVAPQAEASLEFQEFADLLSAALRDPRPNLRRSTGGVADSQPMNRPEIVLTLSFQVIDRGTAIESYPVYATHSRMVYGPYGPVHHMYPAYAGQAVETVQLGFVHGATLSAWIWDATQSSGRRVIWEGRASLLRGDPDLRAAMPYLAIGLAENYGQPTEHIETMKFKRHDERVEALQMSAVGMPDTLPFSSKKAH